MMLRTELVIWTIVCITGTVGVIHNFLNYDCLGKKFWTFLTLVVGTVIGYITLKVPLEVIQVWTAVTGATLFYDTFIKIFQRILKRMISKEGE